jgi:hypothetical protein
MMVAVLQDELLALGCGDSQCRVEIDAMVRHIDRVGDISMVLEE